MENLIREDEIELFDYLKILYKYKYFILIVTFVSVISAVAFSAYVKQTVSGSSIGIKLSFEGIQNGLYPDGTKFRKNDMINPKFLTEAVKPVDIKAYAIDREILTLRLRPFAREIIPKLVQEKWEAAKNKNSLETFEFFPDEFEIYLQEPDDVTVPAIVREAILEGITENWIIWFESKFIEPNVSTNILDKMDLSNYEFFAILDLIETNAENALSNIENIPNELRNFRSAKVGLTAGDLKMMLKAFLENDLFSTKSLVAVERIYKDTKKAEKFLNYKVESLKKDRDKADAKYEFVSSMMTRVENINASPLPALFTLMFNKNIENIPSSGAKEKELLNIAPNIFQTLATDATKSGVRRTELEEEIKFITEKIEEIKLMGSASATIEVIKEYNKKTNLLVNKLTGLINALNALQLELNVQKLNNPIKIMSGPTSYVSSKGLKKIGIISFMAGLFLSVFLSFFINYIREHQKG